MEIWKDVVGFERAYQVSNLGRVKSKIRHGVISERLLKPFKNNQGYECVDLWDNNQSNITRAILRGGKAGGLRWAYDFGGEE